MCIRDRGIPKKKKTPPPTNTELIGLAASKYCIAVRLGATTSRFSRINLLFKLLKQLVEKGAVVNDETSENFVAFLHEASIGFPLQQHVANFFLNIGVDFAKDYFGTGNSFAKFAGTRPELFRWMLDQDKKVKDGRKYYPDIDRKYTISAGEVAQATAIVDGSVEVDVAAFLEDMGYTAEQAAKEAAENTVAAQLAVARIQLQASELLEHAEAGPATLLDDILRQYLSLIHI